MKRKPSMSENTARIIPTRYRVLSNKRKIVRQPLISMVNIAMRCIRFTP